MAKYTYSFSCTIKYRFDTEQDNPEKPIFDNSSFLYTCQSDVAPNTKLAEMTGIKIVLPEYLQGTEEGVIWYSSRTDGYKDEYKITGNKELDISLWTPNNEKTSQVGTFISYELSIYLYSNTGEKTIDWTYLDDNGKYQTLTTFSRQQILTTPEKDAQEPDKEAYKNFYNSFILVNAPKIPTAVSVQETDTLTLYTFNTWTVTREKDNYNNYTNTYNIEAQYEETSFPASLPYTKKSKDPFADAEPYHYGVGTPPDGYFMPIGDDEDSTTDEIKVQAAEKNGYSTIKKLDDFKIKGKSIQYIEKGTFPLPQLLVGVEGEGGSFQDHKEGDIVDTSYGDVYGDDTADEACNHHHFCRLDISYDSNNTVKSIIFHKYQTDSMWEAEKTIARLCLSDSQNHDSYCIGHLEIQSSVGNFTNHGHPGEFPKTLGFILTGGVGELGAYPALTRRKMEKKMTTPPPAEVEAEEKLYAEFLISRSPLLVVTPQIIEIFI